MLNKIKSKVPKGALQMLMKQVKSKSIGPTPEQAPGTWKMVHKMKMAMISTNDVSSTSAIMSL